MGAEFSPTHTSPDPNGAQFYITGNIATCSFEPIAPAYVGIHAPNKWLTSLQIISLGTEEGPKYIIRVMASSMPPLPAATSCA